MTYKSLGICPCTRLESCDSLSQFLSGTEPSNLSKTSLLNFRGKVLVSIHDFVFFPQMARFTYSFAHSHMAAAQPVSQQKLDCHCRGNGTVTDVNVPCADFPSQSMVSNWQPSQHKAILSTLVPLPPMKRGFFQ